MHQREGCHGGQLGDHEAEDEAGPVPGAVTAHHPRVLVAGGPGQAPQVTLKPVSCKVHLYLCLTHLQRLEVVLGGDCGEHLDPDRGRRLAVLAHTLRIIQGYKIIWHQQ